mgnify:CR=1 FL=1
MMLVITIERTDGQVDRVERPDLSRSYADSPRLRAQLIQANANAVQRDPARGGTVLSIEWVEPAKDAETLAWEHLERTRGVEETAQDAVSDRSEDWDWQALRTAIDLRKAAEQAYIAQYGLMGKHIAEEREKVQAERQRRIEEYRNSFIGRGLD